MNKSAEKLIANNKKARHEYFIEEVMEAGIVLKGTEVKSIRLGKVSIKESYCMIEGGEVFIHGLHISPYEHGNIYNMDPLRKRKLLLHRREINKLLGKVKEKGYALVPLSIWIREGLVKVDIALAKGKKLYDKRETLAKKDATRRIETAIKESGRW
ncbi:MAG: SsrA-binding protein SmpB [Tissierellia bacterium]|nr:SsrA-binding protein SmpB [Tissierellia bacterium]